MCLTFMSFTGIRSIGILWLRLWRNLWFRGAFLVGILVLLGFIVHHVESGKGSFLPPCTFYEATHLYCPGCGNTRALRALVHGDILLSLRCNILLLPGIAMVFFLFMVPRLSRSRTLCRTVLVIVLLFSILRNLPWAPFTLLAPM